MKRHEEAIIAGLIVILLITLVIGFLLWTLHLITK